MDLLQQTVRRRTFLRGALAGVVLSLTGCAQQSLTSGLVKTSGVDRSVEILGPDGENLFDDRAQVQWLAGGMRWGEGPVYFPATRQLLVSDIPNSRIMQFDEVTAQWSTYRSPSNNPNGNTRDLQGRLVSCEILTRRVTRTEASGAITVLADSFEGKPLNSPNDVVCKSDGSIWFTDPFFSGIKGVWEGVGSSPVLPQSVYHISPDGKLRRIIDDLDAPNGLAFSLDESKLYVIESRARPSRVMWSYDVARDGYTLTGKTKLFDANGAGAMDGFRVDLDGNLWCGWGSDGRPGAAPADFNGVKVFNSKGDAIAMVHLPERCPNVCFGSGRLYMATPSSLYALTVRARSALRPA